MTENELIELQDKGLILYKFKTGSSSICVVLKVRIPTDKIIAYIIGIKNLESKYSAIKYTMERGMKLNKHEALGFFPEQVKNIVKHYYTD